MVVNSASIPTSMQYVDLVLPCSYADTGVGWQSLFVAAWDLGRTWLDRRKVDLASSPHIYPIYDSM